MSDSTYEFSETKAPLECYEWDRTWIAHTEDKETRRIFYVGDSISWDGIRGAMQNIVGSEFYIDALATSKALDNLYLLPMLDLMLRQIQKPKLMLFNNGLHGWHLDDEKEYPVLLERLLRYLTETYHVSVAVVLTTRVKDPQRNLRVNVRNREAAAVAEKLNLPVIDLYCPSEEYASLQKEDGVHFSREGYNALAKSILGQIRNLLA